MNDFWYFDKLSVLLHGGALKVLLIDTIFNPSNWSNEMFWNPSEYKSKVQSSTEKIVCE